MWPHQRRGHQEKSSSHDESSELQPREVRHLVVLVVKWYYPPPRGASATQTIFKYRQNPEVRFITNHPKEQPSRETVCDTLGRHQTLCRSVYFASVVAAAHDEPHSDELPQGPKSKGNDGGRGWWGMTRQVRNYIGLGGGEDGRGKGKGKGSRLVMFDFVSMVGSSIWP
jgi:hypothetical protein